MSYSRKFSKTIAVPYSGSKSYSYPASEHGGTVTIHYSGTAYEEVEVDIHVDTAPFESSVSNCNSNVNTLTASVGAMNLAQCAAIKENADVVFCNFQRENSDGTWLDCYEMKQRQVFRGNETIELMLDIVASAPYVKVDRKYQMSVWHGIYRRSIIEKYHIRFLSERQVTSEDMPFDVDYLSKCKTIVYRTECFYHYCLNGGSLTAKFFPEKMERYKTLYRYIKPQLQMYGEDGLARANRFYIGMIRSQILHLFKTDRKDKYQIIQRLSYDPIWKEIMNDFKYSWLPVYAAILQWLLLHKCFLFLKIYCKLYNRYR